MRALVDHLNGMISSGENIRINVSTQFPGIIRPK